MRLTILAAALLSLNAGAALAQADPPTTEAPPTPPAQPERPPAIGDNGAGVIRPPRNIDPGLAKQPPAAADHEFPTPVVRPPGTPGGDQDVVPK